MSKQKTSDTNKTVVDMKTHILTVAQDLMTKNGIRQTTLKDIAKEAGISKGTLYYYYSAKDDIIYDIADRNLTRVTSEVCEWIKESEKGLSHKEMLTALFEKILQDATRNRLHLYLISEAITQNEELLDRISQKYVYWQKMLNSALDDFLPWNRFNNSALSCLIMACLDGMSIQNICVGSEFSVLQDKIIGLLCCSILERKTV